MLNVISDIEQSGIEPIRWLVWIIMALVTLTGGGVGAKEAADMDPPRLVATLRNIGISVESVAFSLDGRMMASGRNDKTLKLWDVATGKELRTFIGHSGSVFSVVFSPDGKTVLSGSSDKTLRLWDVATGRELRTFLGHSEAVHSVAFSPDGKTVLSGSSDNTLRLWDVVTGRELRNFSGHSNWVTSVAFSPDGRTVLSGSWDKTLKLWDVATGKELRTFRGHSDHVTGVAFLPLGKTILSGSENYELKLWDVGNGKVQRTYSGWNYWVSSIAIPPNGKTILVGNSDVTLALIELTTDKTVSSFKGAEAEVKYAAFSPNGIILLSGGSFHRPLQLWDATAGKKLQVFEESDGSKISFAFSPDGKTLLGAVGSVRIWDLVTGKRLRSFIADIHSSVTKVAFSPDGKTYLINSESGTLRLFDVTSDKEIRTFRQITGQKEAVAFSPDSKTLLSGGSSFDHTLQLWDVATGKRLQTFIGHASIITSVVFSPDGKTVLSGSMDNTLRLWDVATGRELRTFSGHSNWVSSVAYSPDGRTVLSGSYDNTLRLWDVATGRELRNFSGHSDRVKSVAFSPDGKAVLSISEDKTLKLWDIASGRLKATLIYFDDGNWAVIDPEGRYDASNGGDNPHLHWVFENIPIDLSQLKDRYYDPSLLQKVMGFSNEPLRTVPSFKDTVLHRWPEVVAAIDEKNPLSLKIQLTDRGDGYGRVRVRVNGKEITPDARAGKILNGQTAEITLDLDPERLQSGDNQVDVVAWPRVGHIPSRPAVVKVSGAMARGKKLVSATTSQAEPVTLHAVIMGVSRYAGESLRLAFSGKDANDFGRALALSGTRLFGADRLRLHLLSDYVEKGDASAVLLPTRDHLKQAFEAVAKKASAGDILVVYLAGHGVMTTGAEGNAEYYYLSRDAQNTDLSDPAVKKLWGVSSSELTEWIKAIKAAKQVLILDTCAAGGAIEKLVAKRQIPGAQVIALEQLKDRTGIHILAGAAANKVSFEANQYGQGLLTYALLSGMRGAALKDGNVDVATLFQYARDEVPRLARQIGGIQEPRLSSPQGESFVIGRMTEDDRKKLRLAQVKPVIQRASFQDEVRMKDILHLGQRFGDRLKLETYDISRSRLVYVDVDDYPDAWQVSGRYLKVPGGVRLTAHIFRGEEGKGSFEVLLPTEEHAQPDALLAATLQAMGQ
ncbi:MAG: caspase family protein [Pseudomonadota bacterium]|nr:caspase family protein [Pseudomonadota bacterium]